MAQAYGAFTEMEVIEQWTLLERKTFVIVELDSVCIVQFFIHWGSKPSVAEN